MVLAKDIKGADGGVFLAAGTALDDAAIVSIAALGAPFAYIKPNPAFTSPEKDLQRIESFVRYYF